MLYTIDWLAEDALQRRACTPSKSFSRERLSAETSGSSEQFQPYFHFLLLLEHLHSVSSASLMSKGRLTPSNWRCPRPSLIIQYSHFSNPTAVRSHGGNSLSRGSPPYTSDAHSVCLSKTVCMPEVLTRETVLDTTTLIPKPKLRLERFTHCTTIIDRGKEMYVRRNVCDLGHQSKREFD